MKPTGCSTWASCRPSGRSCARCRSKRQTLLFSATLSQEIEALTHEFQRAPKTVQIGRRSNPAETVTQLVYEVPKHLKPALLAASAARSADGHGARLLAHETRRRSHRAQAGAGGHQDRHAALEPLAEPAAAALKDFKSGAVRVLVATDIAARGIDVDGISHVVNYDFPMHSGGLRPSHRPHRPRARGRRRDQLCHAGGSRRAALAGAVHRSRHRAQARGGLRLQRARPRSGAEKSRKPEAEPASGGQQSAKPKQGQPRQKRVAQEQPRADGSASRPKSSGRWWRR